MNNKGIYILQLKLKADKQITIGRKGIYHFSKGHYLYIGSAAGLGGIEGRLKHHISKITKPHWHIDFLRLNADITDIFILEGEKDLEHNTAKKLESFFLIPMEKFGSSDCGCKAHLFYSVKRINLAQINKITSFEFIKYK